VIRPVVTLRRRRLIIDVDTQKDFLLANGSACVRNHRRVLQNIRRVMAWARMKNVRVISTKQVYDPGHSGNGHGQPYCIRGTEGCRKVPYTVRKNHITFVADGCTDLPRDILKTYDQVVLHKRCSNPFEEPRADRLLGDVQVNEFVVIGATTEDAVKHTVLGLLLRRKSVTVLVDAVGACDRGAAEIALRQMEAKGAKLAETKALLGSSSLRLVGVCACDRCQGRLQKKSFGVGA
jgi:nicotinamidase-related amidase